MRDIGNEKIIARKDFVRVNLGSYMFIMMGLFSWQIFTSVLDGFVSRLGFKSLEKGEDDGGVEDLFSANFSLQGMGAI